MSLCEHDHGEIHLNSSPYNDLAKQQHAMQLFDFEYFCFHHFLCEHVLCIRCRILNSNLSVNALMALNESCKKQATTWN